PASTISPAALKTCREGNGGNFLNSNRFLRVFCFSTKGKQNSTTAPGGRVRAKQKRAPERCAWPSIFFQAAAARSPACGQNIIL
ncbi:MAG TPA: hypothetical protein PK858_11690, partial [Saprospiraceae bacterium]|nr:hypothetical protein [Saprospiraceae bacterium]